MSTEKSIVVSGQTVWYGEQKLGQFKSKAYSAIIDLFVRTGGCKRGDFNEIIALPGPGQEADLVHQLKPFLYE